MPKEALNLKPIINTKDKNNHNLTSKTNDNNLEIINEITSSSRQVSHR